MSLFESRNVITYPFMDKLHLASLVNMTATTTTTKTVNKKKTWRYLREEDVRRHSSYDDCWVIYKGYVYDVTNFLNQHPGGSNLILSHAGKDVKNILDDSNIHQHTDSAYKLLQDFRIGKLIQYQDDINCETKKDIEDEFSMDGWNEEQLDWDQGLVKQVHKLGPNYLKWVHSPVNRKLRLFDSDFIEFFSKTPWYMIPIIWIPVLLILSHISIQEMHNSYFNKFDSPYQYTTLALYAACFLLGLPIWTFVEYFLHRYLFHLEPKGDSPVAITLHFFLHGQHHKVPFDSSRLVFPPVAAAVFAWLMLTFLTYLIPGGFGRAMGAGGILGYVIYDLTHYYLHHGTPDRGSYLHSLKYYHVLHHFDDDSTGFGISTKFWDYPFNTINKKLL